MLCCDIRKSRPLARGLSGLAAFFTGLRRAQAKSRASIEVFDRSGAPVKISPLADWTTEDVVRYTHEHGLPEHPLYAAGYTSIGCDPCTRPVVAGEDERAGRWWWESPEAVKECGLHFSADGRAERTVDVLLREVLSKALSPRMTHEGFAVWLTGLSGAGKSTLAERLVARLREQGAQSGTARWRHRSHQSVRRDSDSAAKIATPTSGASVSSPNCSPATASSSWWRRSLLIAMRARK